MSELEPVEPRPLIIRAAPADIAETIHTSADLVVSESTRARIRDGVAKNTTRAYRRQWKDFTAWCTTEGRTPLPATPQTLADYVGHLCDDGKAPATIEQAVAAIRTNHRIAGHKGEPDTDATKLVLRSYRKQRVDNGQRNQKQAPPVTIPALRAMVEVCDTSTPIGLRDRALLVIGLALMGRRSELTALLIDDVCEEGDGIEVLIRSSKTDKDARGETIAIPRGSHPLTDPVAVWRDWVDLLASEGHTEGRLLRSVDRHGRIGESLHPSHVLTRVRALAVAAGVRNAEKYTAHSLRAGGATVAYAAGIPISVIARHGRWNPNSPVLLRYIRAVDRWKDNAMRDVGL